MKEADRTSSGVYLILNVFFDAYGAVDEAAMRLQAKRCIAAGAHGISVLGNVTEAAKPSRDERLRLMEIVGDPDQAGQRAFARSAARAGASWVILQPPQITGLPEAEMLRSLGGVAEGCELPVAVQNNPVNMEVSPGNASLVSLHRNHPDITMLKGVGPAIGVRALIEATDGGLSAFA